MDTPDAAKHQNFDIQGKFPYDAIIIGPGDEKYKIAKSGMSLFGKTITILKWSTGKRALTSVTYYTLRPRLI